jgi:hypothetical protein
VRSPSPRPGGQRLVVLVGDEPYYAKAGFKRIPKGAHGVRSIRGGAAASCVDLARSGRIGMGPSSGTGRKSPVARMERRYPGRRSRIPLRSMRATR